MAADRGFTLLEVLIAFLIAALALGVLFRGTVEGQAASATAVRYAEAVSRARSRLTAMQTVAPVPAVASGDDGGGFRWSSQVALLGAGTPGTGARPPALYALSVAVSWTVDGRERRVVLETRRTGIAPPAPP